MKINKVIISIIIFGMFIYPYILVAEQNDHTENIKTLSLKEFITLTCQKDRTFQEILKNELLLQYTKDLILPSGDIILSIKGQYDFALGTDFESGPQATISLNKLFPSIGTSVSAELNSTFSSLINQSRSEFTLSLSQPVAKNAFGKVNRLLDKMTGIEVAIARHQIVEAYEDYLAVLIKMYYSWYSAYANLRTGEMAYHDNVKLLNNIKAKKQNRIALQTDVNKIELQVLSKRENLITLSNQYNQYFNMIKQAIDYNTSDNFLPHEPYFYKKTNIIFTNEYNQFINTSRTYKMLLALEEKGILEINRYANDLLPSANLILGYQIDGSDFQLKKEKSKVFAGISFEMPFMGSKERAQYETSKIELAKTQLSITNKYLQLYMDLKNLYEQIEKEKKLISLADKRIVIANDIFVDETKNYSYGRITLNDLISAENLLEENRFKKIAHFVQLYIYMVEWMRLTDELVFPKDIEVK